MYNTLQYSCLENSMDRRTWRATVHGVAKSQPWLSTSAPLPETWVACLIQVSRQTTNRVLEVSRISQGGLDSGEESSGSPWPFSARLPFDTKQTKPDNLKAHTWYWVFKSELAKQDSETQDSSVSKTQKLRQSTVWSSKYIAWDDFVGHTF